VRPCPPDARVERHSSELITTSGSPAPMAAPASM
jgi:hypothetical protein